LAWVGRVRRPAARQVQQQPAVLGLAIDGSHLAS
jgi:glycosyltransferase A (GT-A) superfamily protein (DUF2064 family)